MSPRDTKTGGVLEAMILPSLTGGGYTYEMQANVGQRPGGRAHRVDALVTAPDGQILVSLKWQQVGGTAEQKIPFEVICLAIAVKAGPYRRAYLVLGGEGWTLRDYFVSGRLEEHLRDAGSVKIVTLEAFVALANRGKL